MADHDPIPPPGGEATPTPWRGIAGFWEKAGAWAMPMDRQGGGYLDVTRDHGPAVGFCLLFVFASSWGQTFLLSVFQPHWMRALHLSPGQLGALYGGATLASGVLLMLGGRWLDQTSPARAAGITLGGLALFSLLAALSFHAAVLAVALFGLRFFGQGLSSNVGMTYAARWFTHNRGKAISLAGLGFPLGELLLPGAVTLAVLGFGWRGAWLVLALLAAGALWPLSRALLARHPRTNVDHERSLAVKDTGPRRRRELLRQPKFYAMLAAMSPLPFVGTGVIFFQATLAESRGWSPAIFPTGFMLFAVVRAFCSLSAGAWVDRVGALRLIPLPPLLFAVGLGGLLQESPWGAYAFFVCLGMSFGAAGAVTTAAWVELFGSRLIGTIRSVSSGVAILITAAAPWIFGISLDAGWPFELMLLVSVALMLGLGWPLSVVVRRLHFRKR